jgi:CheY-like chemotaxis protein
MYVKIVLADDNTSTRPLVEIMLNLFGSTVVHTPCDHTLCDVVRREQPALVVLDLVMFPEAAAAVVAQLRACPATSSIPVIVLSAWHRQEDLYHAAGCDEVVSKPFSRAQLFSAINSALDPSSDTCRPGVFPLAITSPA